MAKGKRAVALFEVINAGKGVPSKPTTGTATTPRVGWWKRFLSRGVAETPSRAAAAGPGVATRPPLPPEPTLDRSLPAADPVTPATREVSPPTLERMEQTVPPTELTAGAVPVPGVDDDPTTDSTSERPVDVRVDRARQLITFRFSYTSAAIASFAVLVVIGLAYVVGRHTSRSPSSDDPFFSAPLRADVLEVARPGSATNPAAETVILADPPPAPVEPSSPTPTPVATGRVIGLNYVVVQSFADEKLARDAQQMLAQAGIETTIERGLAGYAGPTWHCVVGTRGFESAVGESHPDYARYVASIREVGRQFAARTRSKEFVPQRYKWREVR